MKKVNSYLSDSDRPIGVFDSGVGGLTVVEAISDRLPNENLVYLGDTARVPYGTKSSENVTKFSRQNTRFLVEKGVKLIVAACNTASALSLDLLKKDLDIPIIGVIEPGARAAVDRSREKKVGVIGTEGTVKSNAYTNAIKTLDSSISVKSATCPLFVPLAEEGWSAHHVAYLVSEEYLKEMKGEIDLLVLGCTHYPMLKKVIQRAIGEDVALVDSAEETALEVERELDRMGLLAENRGEKIFYVSDNPERFSYVGKRFLGHGAISEVHHIDIDNY